MVQTAAQGPFKLLTVNTAPERAKRLIGLVTHALSDQYTVIHVANCESIDDVAETVRSVQPDLVCCASMWTPKESMEIQRIAKNARPLVKTYALPEGLQVQQGPEAVVELLKIKLPELINSK